MVSSCRNSGTLFQELRYPFAGTAVQFRQDSSLVFLQNNILRDKLTEEAVHREVKGRIIMLNRLKQAPYPYIRIKFLFNLPHKSLFARFSRLNLSSRELPAVLKLAVSPLRGKNPAVLNYNCCNNLNCLHLLNPSNACQAPEFLG